MNTARLLCTEPEALHLRASALAREAALAYQGAVRFETTSAAGAMVVLEGLLDERPDGWVLARLARLAG